MLAGVTDDRLGGLFLGIHDSQWISCFGAEDIETPNTDALAVSGMKFHHAYSMPSCTPSRAPLRLANTLGVTGLPITGVLRAGG